MRERKLIAVALALVVSSTSGLFAGQALKVKRHNNASLEPKIADAILADASLAIRTNDGAGDVPCDVTLSRDPANGPIETFPSPGSVDSSTDYNKVCAQKGRFHVVQDITFCGSPCPNCIGCSDFPGTCMIVVRHDPAAAESVLWAHEYGHNVGLDDVTAVRRIMNGTIETTNRHVTKTECAAYQKAAAPTPSGDTNPAMDVRSFVRRIYIHGTPYEEARKFSKADVPILLDMLKQQENAPYVSNIVLTLGIIGDPSAVQPLKNVIEAGPAQDKQSYREGLVARRSAVIALGYLYFQSKNDEAFQYLLGGAQPSVWSQRGLKAAAAPAPEGARSVREALTIASIQALGMTGDGRAEKALKTVETTGEAPDLREAAKDALRVYGEVKTRGPAAFSVPSRNKPR